MKRELYIFGVGGFAKEVYYLALDTKQYQTIVFVDKSSDTKGKTLLQETIPVIREDEFEAVCTLKKLDVAIAIADNQIVRSIYEKFEGKCNFPNIIHPDAKLLDVKMEGIGNLVTYGNYLSYNVLLGSFNRINIGSIIGHDCNIGNFNQINPHCTISGNVRIGDFNLLGTGSTLLQGIKVGTNNVLGIGAVVLADIKDQGVYIGNPARLMAKNKK